MLIGDDRAPTRARVVIVGGGFAGLEVARHLAGHGITDILVLEGGPAGDMRHTNLTHAPDAAARLWLDPRDDPYHRRPWSSANAPHFLGNAGIRERLGGRSLYWYGVALPLDGWALDPASWPAPVLADLTESWRGGPPLYQRAAADLGLPWQHGTVVAPGRAGSLGAYELMPVPRAIRTHADAPGRWSAYSPLDHWRDPTTGAMRDGPAAVRFLVDTPARFVRHDHGRVTGVVVADPKSGAQVEVDAEAVVLCAGTVENSRLAIQALSGAGPAVPRLGALADHISQGFFVRIDASAAPRPLPLRPGFYHVPVPEARSIVFVTLWRASRDELVLDVKINGELPPHVDSYVECTPGPTFPWPTTVSAAPGTEGRRVVDSQRTVLNGVWAAVADAFGLPGELSFGSFDDPPSTNVAVLPENRSSWPLGSPRTWSSPLGSEDHEGGTLPLGGVLTEHHELPEIAGLYAAGPATFARIGAANPSLTTMALARRLAALLAERLGATVRSSGVAE